MLTKPNYHFTVGSLNCIAIDDGSETVPAESAVRDLPLEQWSRALTERGYSSIESVIYYNCLYIHTGSQHILVDTGWGQGTQYQDGALLEQLQAEGIALASIDRIILTHEDIDHIGGILNAGGGLVFPNAEYILPKDAWEFWNDTPLVARWPEDLTVFGRMILPHIRDRVRVVETGEEFLPGFQLFSAPGHRPGHAVLAISSGGERLLHLADLVGHPVLMEHPSWRWAYDYRTDQAEQDKRQILDRACREQALVFASHLPFPGLGRVAVEGDGWRWLPVK